MKRDEADHAEAVLSEYLLSHSDQIVMTIESAITTSISLWPFGSTKKFERLLQRGDLAAKTNKQWVFNVTDNVKKLFKEKGLRSQGPGYLFKGLIDPKFMKAGHEIASMIVNEKILDLYIPDTDKAQLSNQGVYTDSPEL